MPPHLHPRSRMTSSLFATTVAVSFAVVALPHILPCPAPRVTYADSSSSSHPDVVIVEHVNEDGTISTTTRQRIRRRRAPPTPSASTTTTTTTEVKDGIAKFSASSSATDNGNGLPIEETIRTRDRECPVPKPGGVLGELLSYVNGKKSDTYATPPPSPPTSSMPAATQSGSIPRPSSEVRPET